MTFRMLWRIAGVCGSSNLTRNLAGKKFTAKENGRKKPTLFHLMTVSPVCPFQAYCSKVMCARGFVHGPVASAGSGMDQQHCRFLAASAEPPRTASASFRALRSEHTMPNAGEGCRKDWSQCQEICSPDRHRMGRAVQAQRRETSCLRPQ